MELPSEVQIQPIVAYPVGALHLDDDTECTSPGECGCDVYWAGGAPLRVLGRWIPTGVPPTCVQQPCTFHAPLSIECAHGVLSGSGLQSSARLCQRRWFSRHLPRSLREGKKVSELALERFLAAAHILVAIALTPTAALVCSSDVREFFRVLDLVHVLRRLRFNDQRCPSSHGEADHPLHVRQSGGD